jgi:ankyrin repeat protein
VKNSSHQIELVLLVESKKSLPLLPLACSTLIIGAIVFLGCAWASGQNPENFARSNPRDTKQVIDAILTDNAEALKCLIDAGLDVNLCDEKGNTPLTWCIVANKKQCFSLLLQSGADPNQQNLRGISGISRCAGKGSDPFWLTEVLKYGGNPNLVNQKSRGFVDMYPDTTPLFDAVESGNLENVQNLLKAGASIDQKNGHGNTPLMIAVSTMGLDRIAYCLIQAGADFRVRDTEGRSVADIVSAADEELLIDINADNKEDRLKNEANMRKWHRKLLGLLKDKGALKEVPLRQGPPNIGQ